MPVGEGSDVPDASGMEALERIKKAGPPALEDGAGSPGNYTEEAQQLVGGVFGDFELVNLIGCERTLTQVVGPGGPPAATLERLGHYELLGKIAEGGMGVVYRAHNPELNRELAIKVMKLDVQANHDLRLRFVEEAQVMGQLQHPGIPPIFERGVLPDGRLFYAMKLVKGDTLAALLGTRSGPLDDLPRWLAIFEQVSQTLAYAHGRRVIHRDLKPLNVMVGGFGEVQVMDWGLTKVLGPGDPSGDPTQDMPISVVRTVRTKESRPDLRTGQIGTPAYMPKEQARGETARVDEQVDVFALGAILCEILTGRPAYTGLTAFVKAQRADLADAHARLDKCRADAELVHLARRCLEAERDDRPRDASVVAKEITTYLAGVQERLKAAELARVEAQTKAAEESKRRKLTVALATAVLVVFGLAGFWVFAYQRQVQHEVARIEGAVGKAEQLRDDARRAWSERIDASLWARAEEAAGVVVALVNW